MKSKKTRVRGLVRQIAVSCGLAALITGLAEFFLLVNLSLVNRYLTESGRPGLASASGYGMYDWMLLLVGVGLLVFLGSFFLMERKTVDYMLEISRTMERLADGDLDASVEVRGDNELSVMAEDMNALAVSMRRLIDREREAEAQKNELITNVAHDLRTPLTSINGYLQLLSMPGLTEEQREKYLNIVTSKAGRLETLIGSLFDFTRLSFEKVRMKPEQLDLVNLLAQLLEESYPLFEAHGMVYSLTAETSPVPMTADGNLLARLFDNLIGNAIKYGQEGKSVEVTVGVRGSQAHVEVRNYGRIIPPEKLEHVFDKLYRAEESRQQNIEGHGLGLAIAKNIAEMHGGRIAARSGLDGTVFSVDLPLVMKSGVEDFERDEG